MKESKCGLTSTKVVIDGYPVPQEALVLFSPQTGLIQEVIVKSTMPASEYYAKKKSLQSEGVAIKDYKNDVIMPGLVEVCVSFQEPSRGSWEGYFVGTKAACSGGVTTVFDMPVMGSPYTSEESSLGEKLKASHERLWADCGFVAAVYSGRLSDAKSIIDKGIFGIFANIGNTEYYGLEPISDAEFVELQNMLHGSSIPLMLSCQKCDEVKLKTRSPFRTQPPEKRAVSSTDSLEEEKATPSIRSMDLPIYLPPVHPPLSLQSQGSFKGKDKVIHKLRRSLHDLVAEEVKEKKGGGHLENPIHSSNNLIQQISGEESKEGSTRSSQSPTVDKSKSAKRKSLFSGEIAVTKPIPKTENYKKYLENFEKKEEVEPVKEVLEKASKAIKIHFLNVTTDEAILEIAQKMTNQSISYSLGPHYIYFSENEVEDKDTRFKLTKPILSEESSLTLLKTLIKTGSNCLVSSMHFPVAAELKQDIHNFYRSMPGANSLGFTLQAMWTIYKTHTKLFEDLWGIKGEECIQRYLMKMAEWMCKNPANLMGIDEYKGSISKGKYADFVVWDPEEARLCSEEVIYTSNYRGCIYHNVLVECEVKATFLRGTLVFENGHFLAKNGKVIMSNQPGLIMS